MGADAVASSKQGRCPITAITVAKGIQWYPWVRGPVDTIMQMIGILIHRDRGDVGREWFASHWDLDHASHPWSRIKGPIGATHMHLREVGWQAHGSTGSI
eukprot:3772437-Karenia_brevis.AAC.1